MPSGTQGFGMTTGRLQKKFREHAKVLWTGKTKGVSINYGLGDQHIREGITKLHYHATLLWGNHEIPDTHYGGGGGSQNKISISLKIDTWQSVIQNKFRGYAA